MSVSVTIKKCNVILAFCVAEQSDQSRDDSPSVLDKELDDHFTAGNF